MKNPLKKLGIFKKHETQPDINIIEQKEPKRDSASQDELKGQKSPAFVSHPIFSSIFSRPPATVIVRVGPWQKIRRRYKKMARKALTNPQFIFNRICPIISHN